MSEVLIKDSEYKFPHLLVVSASAGSGKTHALTLRYVQFLLSPAIPQNEVQNILAITFTKNAAREMKERIISWLKALALGSDQEALNQTAAVLKIKPKEIPSAAAGALDRILKGYSDFQVQTIDSFDKNIFMSSISDFDLPPDIELALNYTDLLNYAIADMLSRAGKDEALDRLLDDFISTLNLTEGETFAWKPEERMARQFSSLLHIEAKKNGTITDRSMPGEVDRLLSAIKTVYEGILAEAQQNGHELRKPTKFMEYAASRDVSALLGMKISDRTLPVAKPKKADTTYQQLMGRWLDLKQAFDQLAYAHAASYYSAYARLFGDFKTYLTRSQKQLGIVHLNDLGRYLNGYLREEIIPEVYLRMGARLNHFLIDEFQDTSPMQWLTLDPLLREALSRHGSLFVVGDVKQAIYMFRSADYRIMRQMMEEVKSGRGGEKVPASVAANAQVKSLLNNYRSGGVIVDYVDSVFKGKLKAMLGTEDFAADDSGLTEYEQQALPDRKARGFVQVKHIPAKAPEPENGENDEAEAPAAETAEQGQQEPGREDLLTIIKDVLSRGYSPRDIAVLAHKNAQLEAAVDWLNKAGIPVASSSSLDIRNRKVVAELAELLKFLDSPVDDLSFYRFISGNIMNRAAVSLNIILTPELLHALLAVRRESREYLYQCFKRDAVLGQLWTVFLEPLYQKAGYYPLYDLLSLAMKALNVFANFAGEADSLAKMLESVNGLEAKGANSIRDFLEQAERQDQELFQQELPEYGDAVRLMTFHKAKGLGFPIVINLLQDSRSSGGDSIYYDKEGDDLALYRIAKKTAGVNKTLAGIYERQNIDDQIAELNLLYVICTRAKQELYNLVVYKSDKCFYKRLFDEAELGAKGRAEGGRASPPPTEIILPNNFAREDDDIRGDKWTSHRLHDARKGEVYHRALELVEEPSGRLNEEIERVFARMEREGALADFSAAEAAEMRQQTAAFLDDQKILEWFRPGGGRKIFKEKHFIGQEGKLFRMDRLIIEDDKLTLVDFKTGREGDHRQQMKEYAEILREVYPGKKIGAFIAHIETAKVEELS